jgi:hypothetical protein
MKSASCTRGSFVRHRGFESPGRENEHFFLVDAHPDQAFKDQLDQLERDTKLRSKAGNWPRTAWCTGDSS